MNGDLGDYQKLFDAIGTMVYIITTSGIILAVNREVIRKTGYERSELVGQPVERIHPDGSEKEIKRVLNEIEISNESLCTLPVVSKTGKCVDVETRIYRGTWEGQSVLFGLSTDVTSQKLTEYKCRAIFQNSPIPILVSKISDGTIIDVNAAWCELFGFNKEEIIGKTTIELGLWEDETRRDVLQRITKATDEQTFHNEPVSFHILDGSTIYGVMSGSRITINEDDCWITSFIDKTAEYLLEKQLDEIREISIASVMNKLSNQLSENKYIRW